MALQLRFFPEAEAEVDSGCFQVCSDGGCRSGTASLAVGSVQSSPVDVLLGFWSEEL